MANVRTAARIVSNPSIKMMLFKITLMRISISEEIPIRERMDYDQRIVRLLICGDTQHLAALVRHINPAQLEVIYGNKRYISWKKVQFITSVMLVRTRLSNQRRTRSPEHGGVLPTNSWSTNIYHKGAEACKERTTPVRVADSIGNRV